jgi:hypothetical protein
MKNLIVFAFFLTSCSTMKILKYEKEKELAKNAEFEKQVVVKLVEEPVVVPVIAVNEPVIIKPAAVPIVVVKKAKKQKNKPAKVIVLGRQPELEDSEGFNNFRRPMIDPFQVGEKVIHSVSYFSAEAGRLTISVNPFLEVNNKKSYHFQIGLKTSSLFSKFYSVDDIVDTYMDFESLVPHVFKTSIRETGKLSQAQVYFNHETLKSNYWEKKYTEKNGEEEIKKSWDLLPFSQNAFSGIFYMRIFNWTVGKQYSFRVSDDEKNVIFKGTALSKEKLNTEAGEFKAIKIKADIITRGAMTPSGNIYIWISDDERKLILRIEAEIKIGKLVSEIVEIEKGQP